jgi:hypothetical protein
MKAKQRFPWIQVSAAAAVLVVGVVAWLQIPVSTPAPKADAPMPVLGFMRLDPAAHAEVMAEQLAAYDPTPLFLPTAMNSGQKTLFSEERTNVDGPFGTLPAQLVFSKDKANLVFKPIVDVPSGPVQGLALTDLRAFSLVIGRTDGAGEALPSRAGYLEVARTGDGRVVLSLSLVETANRPQGDWQPMELQGAVSRFGLVGGLVVTVSSGSDVIDDYFSAQLTKTLRVGERLPSGFYTFRIGP